MSLVQQLETLAQQTQAPCLFFLNETGQLHEALSYKELFQQAAGLAKHLAANAQVGDSVWLLFDHSPAFLKAFYACLMARLTAVPLPPPQAQRGDAAFETLRPLAAQTHPRWVLAEEPLLNKLRQLPFLPESSCFLDIQTCEPITDPEFKTTADDRAVLLFTSGSTAQPKGISLRSRHLAYNATNCCNTWQIDSNAVLVSWMPNHHSFGMVFNALLPIHSGCRWVGMAPQTFLAKPETWLQVMHQYAGTHTAAATFGYQYAVDHIQPSQIEGLSLKSWRVGLVSAEPVRRGIYLNFMQKFGHLDLHPNFFSPLYGLSESGPITGHAPLTRPRFLEQADLPQNLQLASLGKPMPNTEIRIVDPTTNMPLPEGEVGEIWISGPSVLNRYFQNEAADRAAFRALPGEGGHFFRTGDQGFCQDGELYITGRLKELIIIAGKNYVPQDVEWAFLNGHPALATCKAAAFATGEGLDTRLTVAVECAPATASHRREANAEILDDCMLSVWRQLGLRVDTAVLVEDQQLARTASGKIQRGLTQSLLQQGKLVTLLQRRNLAMQHERVKVVRDPHPAKPNPNPCDSEDLAEQIAVILARQLEIEEHDIDLEASLSAFQLDSLQIMTFAKAIETQLNINVQPAWLFKCDHLMELASLLNGQDSPKTGV